MATPRCRGTITNNGSIEGVAQGSGYYAGGSLASSGSIVTNTGTILGTGQHSIGVALSGVSIVNNNAGTISADFIGVYVGGAGTDAIRPKLAERGAAA